MPGGWLDSMAMFIRQGGEIKVSSSEEVITPAFAGSMAFRLGQPVPEAKTSGAGSATGP